MQCFYVRFSCLPCTQFDEVEIGISFKLRITSDKISTISDNISTSL